MTKTKALNINGNDIEELPVYNNINIVVKNTSTVTLTKDVTIGTFRADNAACNIIIEPGKELTLLYGISGLITIGNGDKVSLQLKQDTILAPCKIKATPEGVIEINYLNVDNLEDHSEEVSASGVHSYCDKDFYI